MSRRDSDSNSNRRHSRFHPEPSPKRYRKYVKQERNRTKSSSNVENQGHRRHNPADPTQPGPSSGQMKAPERGWWKDIKNQHSEKEEMSQGRNQTEEKSQAKLPIFRKRPAFQEKKIIVDSGDGNPAATVAVESSQIDHPPKREEKRSNPYHVDRAHYKDKALSRERQRGNGGFGNSRGKQHFNGRQGYLPSKTQTQKWKHDLYHDVNKDPIPLNEDDQIAKLEALLAS